MSNGKGTGGRCKECGYKVRGSNHNEGSHHKTGNKKHVRPLKPLPPLGS